MLTCSPPGGRPLSAVLAGLKAYLDRRRDRSVPLAIREARPVPFRFRATLHVVAGRKQSAVRDAALGVLQGPLDPDRLPLGETVHLSRLLATFQAVPGVEWVELVDFDTDAPGHDFRDPSGRLEAAYVGPDEVARPASIVLDYSGGVNDLELP